MKFVPNRILIILVALLVPLTTVIAAPEPPPPSTPPPPPGLPLDGSLLVLVGIALFYSFYKIYVTNARNSSL